MVFISFKITGKVTSLPSGTSYACITNLPYTPIQYSSGECGLSQGISYNLTTDVYEENFVFTVESGIIVLRHYQGASASAIKLSGNNNFEVGASGWYETAQ